MFTKMLPMIGLLLSLTAFQGQASQFDLSGDTEFVATGRPSSIKIRGQGNGVSGRINIVGMKVTGDISFVLNQFSTGIELRDKHMKEKYLETLKFPVAKLTINQVSFSKDPGSSGYSQKAIPFAGSLNLHGVSRPVNGLFDLNTSGSVAKGDAQFDLKITDFNISVPKYLGITVTDTVKVTVHLEGKKLKSG